MEPANATWILINGNCIFYDVILILFTVELIDSPSRSLKTRQVCGFVNRYYFDVFIFVKFITLNAIGHFTGACSVTWPLNGSEA